jgi:hypothetical protein
MGATTSTLGVPLGRFQECSGETTRPAEDARIDAIVVTNGVRTRVSTLRVFQE